MLVIEIRTEYKTPLRQESNKSIKKYLLFGEKKYFASYCFEMRRDCECGKLWCFFLSFFVYFLEESVHFVSQYLSPQATHNGVMPDLFSQYVYSSSASYSKPPQEHNWYKYFLCYVSRNFIRQLK